jgi:hypothetical protein
MVPLTLAAIALAGICVLLAWDVHPQLFAPKAHSLLGAFPLALIAFTWLAHHALQRASFRDSLKAILLSIAFLFWAANQCLSNLRLATVCNDIAIALFVLDLVFIIASRPSEGERGSNELSSTYTHCCDSLGCKVRR